MIKQKQVLGLIGIFFAILGGILWFFQQHFIAFSFWGIAGIIMFKLNKRHKIKSKK